jgi:hypothetical protein
MSRWRFLLFDAPTRQPVAELDVVGEVTFTEELNRVGSFTCSIPMDQPVNSPVTMSSITPPRAVWAAEKDDVLVWAGFIWTHEYDDETGLITLGGGDYLSYLHRRRLRATLNFVQQRQEVIGWQLISYVQSVESGFNLGIVDKSTPSVTLRDRTYYWYERKDIGEALEQLAAVRGGFDFRLGPTWSNGPNSDLVIEFTTVSPPVGRRTDIVLEAGSQINVPTATLDGTEMAYRVEAIGRGEGESTPMSDWFNSGLIAANLPLDKVIQLGDVEQVSTLSDHAHAELQRSKWPIRLPRVKTTDADLINVFLLGDQVRYKYQRGIVQIDATYRSVSHQVTVGENGEEAIAVTLAPIELFDAD